MPWFLRNRTDAGYETGSTCTEHGNTESTRASDGCAQHIPPSTATPIWWMEGKIVMEVERETRHCLVPPSPLLVLPVLLVLAFLGWMGAHATSHTVSRLGIPRGAGPSTVKPAFCRLSAGNCLGRRGGRIAGLSCCCLPAENRLTDCRPACCCGCLCVLARGCLRAK